MLGAVEFWHDERFVWLTIERTQCIWRKEKCKDENIIQQLNGREQKGKICSHCMQIYWFFWFVHLLKVALTCSQESLTKPSTLQSVGDPLWSPWLWKSTSAHTAFESQESSVSSQYEAEITQTMTFLRYSLPQVQQEASEGFTRTKFKPAKSFALHCIY